MTSQFDHVPSPTISMTSGVVRSSVATVAAVLPMFLLGALGADMTRALGFGVDALGFAVAILHGCSAAVAVPAGRLVDRMGASRSLRAASTLAACACVGVAGLARSWISLVGILLIAGLAHALVVPASNRMLARVVDLKRLGLAFGLKQSAPPIATLLAGISVPALAVTVGWRWAWAAAAVFSLLVATLVVPNPRQPRRLLPVERPPIRSPLRLTVMLAVTFGFGTATASTVPYFLVEYAVQNGISTGIAGIVLASASIGAIVARVVAGFACDRIPEHHLLLCAALLLGGAVGLLILAQGADQAIVLGAVVAMTGTWGFNGVFWYSLIRSFAESPGAITGAVAPGGLIGGMLGPILFGLLVTRYGWGTGWLAASVTAVVAAVAMMIADRELGRLARK